MAVLTTIFSILRVIFLGLPVFFKSFTVPKASYFLIMRYTVDEIIDNSLEIRQTFHFCLYSFMGVKSSYPDSAVNLVQNNKKFSIFSRLVVEIA